MNATRQPTLADLTSRSMAARAASSFPPDEDGDVEPHEVLSGIRVDVRAAWIDAQLPLALLGVAVAEKSIPADWSGFVEWNSGRLAIPMAAGHFPQRLRDVAGLFAADLADAPPAKTGGFASLLTWIERGRSGADAGAALLAFGIARELGDAPAGDRGITPAELNERGADLWCRRDREGALAIWESMPAGAVASFNIGMANLMLGRARAASAPLWDAVARLPENSGWHHLAALYLSVAGARG